MTKGTSKRVFKSTVMYVVFTNELKISIGIEKITVKHTFLEESINKVFSFNLKHFFTSGYI